MITINKQPNERLPLAFEFLDRLPLGGELSSGVFSAIDIADGSDVTIDILVSPTGTVSGTQVRFSVIAGTEDHVYKVTLRATLTDGSILEEDVKIAVGEI
jgi:hypothetical protein